MICKCEANNYIYKALFHQMSLVPTISGHTRSNYKNALESIKKYPLPIVSKEIAKSLIGVGRFIAGKIDKIIHDKSNGIIHDYIIPEDNVNHSLSLEKKTKKKKSYYSKYS